MLRQDIAPETISGLSPSIERPAVPGPPQVERAKPIRNLGIDAYRGFVMFLMMAEVLSLPALAEHYPQSFFWRFIGFHTEHVEWYWASLHDLIQPSFSFLVGSALAYSAANRMKSGQSFNLMLAHALWRSLLLVCLGIFLRSLGAEQTYFTFEDTLTQIGLGYPFLFLLGFCSERTAWITLAVILVGYWLAFALYPLPPIDFDYARVGLPADWPYHATGFAAHWNKNFNFAHAFDLWFLNLFPRAQKFEYNGGGYLTLSFIPTLGTMILGLIAGKWLRLGWGPRRILQRLITTGLVLIAVGAALHFLGICPVVKRIWTPSWTLFSGGICFIFLAGFYGVIDLAGYRKWAFLFLIIGSNSIAAYLMAETLRGFFADSFHKHLGSNLFRIFGEQFEPTLTGAAVLAVYCLILYWMYRKKIFLRI